MPSATASVYHGAWTFANYGPVTTTYTPPASCSATDRIWLGYVSDGFPHLQDSVQCSTYLDYDDNWDCVPTATATPTWSYQDDKWQGIGAYYSPGLYCPSGWETIGLAARDGNKPATSSGYVTSVASLEPIPYYEEPATLLAGILEPSETMALCCPSGMTGASLGGCYSVVSDYKPSSACYVYTDDSYDYIETTKLVTYEHTTKTRIWQTPITTSSFTSTVIETFPADASLEGVDEEVVAAISYVPMITLVHHQTDLQSTTTGTGARTGAADSTGTASHDTSAATSNAARRLSPGASTWEGLGAVLGVSAAAMAVGAAIILPW
ncbi:hypothetical protein N7462_010461 [Penicillium macrosclerotiorum]|uniref:uncharacterized protein n=1 Tax=Penicillium macrosclerotiorum TaxID=303699 RepID=UPI0025476D52|nr:uncharacterized protein N7462_010461 [Penicillium macrosclerotiorum]KAJ5669391.1 hypothetical protein N7462_010461 [Penicillium macrosclerotiorum]